MSESQKIIKINEFSDKVGGILIQSENIVNFDISGISTIEKANEGDISFISSSKFINKAETSKASFFIVPEGIVIKDKPCVQLKEVWKGIVFLMNFFYPPEIPSKKIHTSAIIDKNVEIGEEVTIDAYCVISANSKIGDRSLIGAQSFIGMNVLIGRDCIIHPNVTIMKDSIIGDRVIIHPGAVIGSDGFKYEQIEGRIAKIPQVGKVVLENDVEVGANTTIDRATLTETRVGAFTKIDNLVQIAHNVIIGKGCLIVSQVGIAGSSKIGNGCIFGGQAGIADNVSITDSVLLAGRAAVKNDIKQSGEYLGAPAIPVKEGAKVLLSQLHLPELIKKVREMKSEIEKIKKEISDSK